MGKRQLGAVALLCKKDGRGSEQVKSRRHLGLLPVERGSTDQMMAWLWREEMKEKGDSRMLPSLPHAIGQMFTLSQEARGESRLFLG